MRLADVAKQWQEAGVSVIPILANQTKRPAIKWSPYQATLPTLGEVSEWWGNGKPYGLAIICGAISGNLEMTEIEGKACTRESLIEVENRMDELGAGHVWDLLNGTSGYSEISPSGGLHLLYRVSDHEVPGNTKLAQEPGEFGPVTLAETRGHGGYVIVAPTPGVCHPSGESWNLINGEYGVLPVITWAERNLLHEALMLALDRMPPPSVSALPVPVTPSFPTTAPADVQRMSTGGVAGTDVSPGDDFEASTDWAEILEPHGWSLESRRGMERHWTRPGKSTREGASATTGRATDRDRIYVFSTSTVFQAETAYTKFGAYALLNHGGDHRAAARELVRQGFGSRSTVAVPDSFTIDPDREELPPDRHTLDDQGNIERFFDFVRGRVYWVKEAKAYYHWDGRKWTEDVTGFLHREWGTLTTRMLNSNDGARVKFAQKCRSKKGIDAAVNLLKVAEGSTIFMDQFNRDRHLLNLHNGVFDLDEMRLYPHNPAAMQTRMFNAAYLPEATCPKFEAFIEAALPDPAMRSYLQRALGYSLLGDVDQRSIFWICGPSGTGKSTLMETIRHIFGEYGAAVPASAFRDKRESGAQPDLHQLKGRRFVTTSETAESASFDEDLLKRLSGRDEISSRTLYQENNQWTPECAIWMATNNAPRFTTDDDAIWRRTKLIPFHTTFDGMEGQVSDYARTVLAPEADGIFNWLLAGLAAYFLDGLGEPTEVREMAAEQRLQSDSVARFMDDRTLDGILVLGEDQRMRCSELHAMYQDWTRSGGERPLATRRFHNRVLSSFPDLSQVKIGGHVYWSGVGRATGVSIMGSFGASHINDS